MTMLRVEIDPVARAQRQVIPSEYVSQKHDPPKGDSYGVRSLDYAASLKRELWIVMVRGELKNKNPAVNYVYAGDAMADRAYKAATINPDAAGKRFHDFFSIVGTIAAWRRDGGLKTVIVVTPPPPNYISVWERSFAEIHLTVAWYNHDGTASTCRFGITEALVYKPIQYKIYKKSPEYKLIERLNPSEHQHFHFPTPTTTMEKRRYASRFKTLVSKLNKNYDDRRYGTRTKRDHVVVFRYGIADYENFKLEQEKYPQQPAS